MSNSYGSDLTALTLFEGGVVSDTGASIVSTSSDGEKATLFGPSSLRAIHGGVTNGDFSALPDDPSAPISDENALPYFTWDNSGGTGIVAQVVPNGTAASGNALRISIGTAVTSGTATLIRTEPIPGSTSDRAFAFIPQMTAIGSLSSGTAALADLFFTWLSVDQSTVVGTAAPVATREFDSFYEIATLSAGDDAFGAASVYNCAPAGAAFLRMTARFRVTGAGTGVITRTLDITDFRIAVGEPSVYLAETIDPDRFAAGYIEQSQGALVIQSGQGTDAGAVVSKITVGNFEIIDGDPTYGLIELEANGGSIVLSGGIGGGVGVEADGGLTIAEGDGSTPGFLSAGPTVIDGTLDVSGDLTASQFNSSRAAADNDVFLSNVSGDSVNRFLIEADGGMFWGSGSSARDTNLYRAAANVLRTDDGLEVGNGSIGSNGTFTGLNANLSGGNGLRHDSPATTTATSNAGIWVLVSGTNYQLRRNSSSARYKTNIVDADEVVLGAARKVKPRHYESTIEDENGATRLGFIAEEVHDAGLTHAVGYDSEGKPETIDSVALIAALWHRVNDLESRLKVLETE